MLVGAVLAPQRADDPQLGEGGLAAQHGKEALILVGGDAMFGDECRSDAGIAGARSDVHGVDVGAGESGVGFMTGLWTGVEGDASFGLAGGFMRTGALLGVDLAAFFADTDSG